MADSNAARSVMPHPPGGVPKYFDGSPYDDAQIAKGGGEKSKALALYDQHAKNHFVDIPDEVTDEQLAWMAAYGHQRVLAEREERRMHFGSFCLVGVLFFLLLPTLVNPTQSALPLFLLEALLLVLLVPYVFVYFGYENRVRAMTLGYFRLLEAQSRRADRRATPSESAK